MRYRPIVLTMLFALTAGAAFAQPPGRGQGGGRGPGPFGRGADGERPAPRDRVAGQAVATGTASIAGRVAVPGTGQPARRARVTLNALEGGGSRTATADDDGRYAFGSLAAGRYSLSASKSGHVSLPYGAIRPGRPGTPIQLRDGEKFAADLQLPRGSVITGIVVDEHGEASAGTPVRVLRYATQGGRRVLQESSSDTTDDRGIYRVYGLQPGEYLVSAVPRNPGPGMDLSRTQGEVETLRQRLTQAAPADAEQTRVIGQRLAMLQAAMAERQEEAALGYAPIYYPGTTTVTQAQAVPVGLGEERSGVDFQLQRVAMAIVEGTVVNSTGAPLQNIQVTLGNTAAQGMPGIGTFGARADQEGRFRIGNVPPGTYRLVARGTVGSPDRPAEAPGGGRGGPAQQPARVWASLDLAVDGRSLSNVVLTLQPGMTVSGRIAFHGTAAPPSDLTRLRVALTPAEPLGPTPTPPATGTVDASGRFTIRNVVPGVYRMTGSGAGGDWIVESSTIDGQDSLDFPVEIKPDAAPSTMVLTFTDKQQELSGVIVDQRGQPAPEQTLILYPADERFWTAQARRIRSARPATDGQFRFGSIPPGEYKLVAMVDVEPGAWQDPAFLQQIDGASTRVTIGEGEKKVHNLQISIR